MGLIGDGGRHRHRKPGLLSNLRFRARIMLGFTAVLGLSAISMGIAHFGFDTISVGVGSYHDIVAETDAARDIDRELAAYAVLARYYAVAGSAADETAAREAEVALNQAIKNTEGVVREENRQKFEELSTKSEGFSKLFAQVVKLKQRPDHFQAAPAARGLLPRSARGSFRGGGASGPARPGERGEGVGDANRRRGR